MIRINKKFFKMAQEAAKSGVELTTYHAGDFDWYSAMKFLKMAYYRCSVEELENFISDVENALNESK